MVQKWYEIEENLSGRHHQFLLPLWEMTIMSTFGAHSFLFFLQQHEEINRQLHTSMLYPAMYDEGPTG